MISIKQRVVILPGLATFTVSQYPCTDDLEILKALAWRDNPLYAGSSFLKWNTPPARIHESVGHSEWIESDSTIWTQLEFQLTFTKPFFFQ
jgi:hypothetical protein